jgi:hypothetical protein
LSDRKRFSAADKERIRGNLYFRNGPSRASFPLTSSRKVNSTLDERRVLPLNSISEFMRFVARLLWIAAFLIATYSWMVAFEHGFGWRGFSDGFLVEWKNLGALLVGKPTPNS